MHVCDEIQLGSQLIILIKPYFSGIHDFITKTSIKMKITTKSERGKDNR